MKEVLSPYQKEKIEGIQAFISPLRKNIENHPLYDLLITEKEIRIFTRAHAVAVFDFMSILKSLQNRLTCTQVPWFPKGSPQIRRFINEIVLAEESDLGENGEANSHFEMYLDAMNDLGVDTGYLADFALRLDNGYSLSESLHYADIGEGQGAFIASSFKAIETSEDHELAAYFTFGREDLIPDMFINILKNLKIGPDTKLDKLIYYFERHIDLDGDEHGPLSELLVASLCGSNENKWEEAKYSAQSALAARLALWDSVYEEIKDKAEYGEYYTP